MNPLAIFRALKTALPMAVIIGLGIALWLARRDANHWHLAYTAAVAAGAASTEAQKAINQATQARTQAIAEQDRERLTNALEHAQNSADSYARAHTVRMCRTDQGRPGPGDQAPADSPAPVDNGPADEYGLAAVPRDKFDELIREATRRAQNYEWGQTLIREGLAVPAFGQ